MQNILIPTIRFGVVAVLALSVFVGEAFAAPVLVPANVTAISDTTATLVGKVANPGYKNTTVWFEWGDTPNSTTVTGMRDIFSEGFFQGYLFDLKPGTTYYFRAVATEGGVTTYSPTVSFTTRGGLASVSTANSAQTAPVSLNGPGASAVPSSQKQTTPSASAKTNTPVSKTASDQKTGAIKNNNAALAINSTGVLPGTLIGWVALLIAVLVAFLVFALIVDSVEERRKAREEAKKKKLEREAETD